MGYAVRVGDRLRLYYLGWNLKVSVPWLNTIGLAIEDPRSGRFERYSPAPLLDRSRHIEVLLGVAYGTDPQVVLELLKATAEALAKMYR